MFVLHGREPQLARRDWPPVVAPRLPLRRRLSRGFKLARHLLALRTHGAAVAAGGSVAGHTLGSRLGGAPSVAGLGPGPLHARHAAALAGCGHTLAGRFARPECSAHRNVAADLAADGCGCARTGLGAGPPRPRFGQGEAGRLYSVAGGDCARTSLRAGPPRPRCTQGEAGRLYSVAGCLSWLPRSPQRQRELNSVLLVFCLQLPRAVSDCLSRDASPFKSEPSPQSR
mmetsp:Transcript_61342/g.200574  ORF Transcript_61342/g.200574 Transcript_61342/m.200574 type:complete len:228 (-) Transcript_61342:71-754(-)